MPRNPPGPFVPRRHPILSQLDRASRELLAQERANAERAVRAAYHAHVIHPLAPRIQTFTDRYSHALTTLRATTGDPRAVLPLHWLHDRGMDNAAGGAVNDLRRFVSAHVSAFGDATHTLVTDGQRTAVRMGDASARELLHAALSPAAHLVNPDELIRTVRQSAKDAFVGKSIAGGTTRKLLDTLPAQASDQLYRTLLYGLSTGESPQSLTTLLWGQLGRSQSRALTVARTEILGAWRAAQLENFRANRDVVDKWQWSASASACPFCTEQDGSLHDLGEDMVTHPNCGCAEMPITRSWEDILGPLGIDASGLDDMSSFADDEDG